MLISLAQIAAWSGGALIQGVPSATVSRVVTDSRIAAREDLFVALVGERFDAHDFVPEVADQAASAMILSSLPKQTGSFHGGIVYVKDTLKALQELARGYRKHLADLRVVGVTGRNGKSTTKDFLKTVRTDEGRV